MDGLTLLIISLIFSTIATCLWLLSAFLFKSSPTTSVHYALTNIVLASFMGFYVARSFWPEPIIFILSDITVILGCMLLRRSIQDFTGERKTDIEQFTLFVVGTVVDVTARLGGLDHQLGTWDDKIAGCTICLISFYCVAQSSREAYAFMIKDFAKKYCLVTLAPLYLMATLLFARIAMIGVASQPFDLRQATPFNTVFLLTLMLSLIGFNGTAIGLVIGKMITRIKTLSQEDPLTKAFNRRHLNEIAEEQITSSYKNSTSLSLIALDVDHFKSVNDKYGHAAGDAALISCITNIKQYLRGTDCVGRLGGEEFCILLPNTSADEALLVAERIRESIAAHPIDWEGQTINITASFGVTSLSSNAKNDWSTLLNKADMAMYEAKNSGRNRTVITT